MFQAFQQFTMYALDRPLIPKYTRAKLTGDSLSNSYSFGSSKLDSSYSSGATNSRYGPKCQNGCN